MPPKRKRRSSSAGNAEDSENKKTTYAMLTSRVRRIPEHKIRTKWATLPDSVQERVKELFHSVERPVITRQRDEKRRIEAQTALGLVRKNLGKRLPRMPFPPTTKDADFDYETALQENRTLEVQLSTASHSADLLRAEIKREEAELSRETAQLERLEANAKAARSERKRQAKNVHPVLRQLDRLKSHGQDPADFKLADVDVNQGMLCELEVDSDLRPLVKQLRSHLESMQNNAAQTAGLGDAIARTQASLNLLPLG